MTRELKLDSVWILKQVILAVYYFYLRLQIIDYVQLGKILVTEIRRAKLRPLKFFIEHPENGTLRGNRRLKALKMFFIFFPVLNLLHCGLLPLVSTGTSLHYRSNRHYFQLQAARTRFRGIKINPKYYSMRKDHPHSILG